MQGSNVLCLVTEEAVESLSSFPKVISYPVPRTFSPVGSLEKRSQFFGAGLSSLDWLKSILFYNKYFSGLYFFSFLLGQIKLKQHIATKNAT